MGESCAAGQYWDGLLKKCIGCHMLCKRPHVIPKCTSYCESAHCKALPGHYYDGLLKKCIRCTAICGRHTAECSEHCQKIEACCTLVDNKGGLGWCPGGLATLTPPPVTTTKLLLGVTSHVLDSRGVSVPTALEDSTILLYSLLALCMVLLFSSLSLALAVLLRGTKAKTSNSGPKEANRNKESVVQPGQEVGWSRQNKDFAPNSNRTTDREPSYDSSPTETCVCVHCFPDLKALGQGNERPQRAPFSGYQQPFLHRAQIQNGGPVWTEVNLHNSGLEEAAVG